MVRGKFIPKSLTKYRARESTIDTNSIYVNKENKFFYKFYSNNKVSITHYKGSSLTIEDINPLKGKMGYFYQENDKVVTFILVKTARAFFNKSYLKIDSMGNLIEVYFDTKGVYKKQKLPEATPQLNPDW
ncbi:hypothetical protein VRU48_01555 [Pedobacter sp. KR3-3]|uniref:Uncharacterized protein n=1 Tax=Pedobacter albus TaxID=3113905 RepID=A0ABU7I2S6_9SPHI|nr:hypothetical protein [Pedobacter sp. KR3-3]MEE1943772.1 hypothetical protein [Pedobacter sp. KR3-3]